MNEKKYVIWIILSNGKCYYLCSERGLFFLSIRENKFLFTNFKSCAKRYTLQGAKGIVTKLWNKSLNFDYAFDGARIIHTSYMDINRLEKEVKLYPNEWDYFIRMCRI